MGVHYKVLIKGDENIARENLLSKYSYEKYECFFYKIVTNVHIQ